MHLGRQIFLCISWDTVIYPTNIFAIKVIQRRVDYGEPREDFNRDWADYKRGFGNLSQEFWLGNDNIHQLTKSGDKKLRVELEAHGGGTAWAEYSTFRVEGEDQGYRLHIGGYSGTAGNSMGEDNGNKFSTRDRDNDEWHRRSCAQLSKGGWWFKNCSYSRLNAVYYTTQNGAPSFTISPQFPKPLSNEGIIWYTMPYARGWLKTLKSTSMTIRRK